MSSIVPDYQTYQVLVQLLVAFGQGAGTLHVSGEVVAAATDYYSPRLRKDLARWEEYELRALEFARGLGRLAAHVALHEGSDRILLKHYEEARGRFTPYWECPYCLTAPGNLTTRR
jgi:hypothetical protein